MKPIRQILISVLAFGSQLGIAEAAPVSLSFSPAPTKGITMGKNSETCPSLLATHRNSPNHSEIGMAYLTKVFADGWDSYGKRIEKDQLRDLSATLSNQEWIQFEVAAEPILKARVHLIGVGTIDGYFLKRLLARLPTTLASIETLGLPRQTWIRLLKQFVGINIHSNVHSGDSYGGENDSYFLLMFEHAAQSKKGFPTIDEKELQDLLATSKREWMTSHAIYNAGLLMRAGLSVGETNAILEELYKGNRVYQGMRAFQHLQAITKVLTDLGANPRAIASTLRTVFGLMEKHYQDLPFALKELKEMIEYQTIEEGKSVDLVLKKIEQSIAQGRKLKSLSGPEINAGSTARWTTDFPLVNRALRPSHFNYKTKKSYEDGVRELYEVAKDEATDQEGAFVFDPDTSTWYSLASHTDADLSNRKVRTLFQNLDLGRFGSRPVFIHLHPDPLKFYIQPDRNFAGEHAPFLASWLASLPSQQDFQTFEKLIQDASNKNMRPSFVIIHGQGTTTIRIDVRHPRFSKITSHFKLWKEKIMRKYLSDFPILPISPEEEEQEMQFLWDTAVISLER